jgi:hypothetical protein
MLFPPQSNILETEIKTAIHVARMVFENNLARVERPADYEAFIRSHVYKPEYRSLLQGGIRGGPDPRSRPGERGPVITPRGH